MKVRYEGEDGRRLLIDALKQQALVQHDAAVAAQLVDSGHLVEFKAGETLISQNDTENSIFLILSGEAAVSINGRHVASRSARESIGEMALLDPAAPRSATVTALKNITALKITEPDFHRIATANPSLWRALAMVVADRLRQRNRFHRAPNERPVLFVGSSVEGLAVAKNIQLLLKHSTMDIRLWTSGVFGPSGVTIDVLLEQLDTCDFAAFVFGPDDKLASRGEQYDAPRDNVIFELGLFMGRVGRERAFFIKDQRSNLKIPTDLLGVTPLTYIASDKANLVSILGPVCTEIEITVGRLGSR